MIIFPVVRASSIAFAIVLTGEVLDEPLLASLPEFCET
jgi:hypothetical protein